YGAGVPLTVSTDGVDPAALGFLGPSASGPRPDVIADPFVAGPVAANPDPLCQKTISQGGKAADQVRTTASWFNTCAFAEVPAGVTRPGNSGRGAARGPGFGRWDLGVGKNIKIKEDVGFQFRAEMFNIFNHTNPLIVNTSRTNSLFGQVTNTRDPRLIQLGLKFYY